MSTRKKGNPVSPSRQAAKETGVMSPISSSSWLQTAIQSMSPQSNVPSQSAMRTKPERQAVCKSRPPLLNRNSSMNHLATAQTANVRLVTSILMLVSLNVSLMIASRLIIWDLVLSRVLASLLVPFVAFFGYQWSHYYSIALTRKKRAFLVEPNILLTYQPRARLLGHLFKPDPPTPMGGVPDCEIDLAAKADQLTDVADRLAVLQHQKGEVKNSKAGSQEERKAFLETRKKFYDGEWAAAMKGLENRADVPLPQDESLQTSNGVRDNVSSAASSSTASMNITSTLTPGKLDNQKNESKESPADEV